MRVCGHPSVCVCVDICHVCVDICHVCTCDCVSVCVLCIYARAWSSACTVYVLVCVCGHVRASVCHYNFVMLMCTIFVLTIIVPFGMDIQYILIWKVWYCFVQFHAGL